MSIDLFIIPISTPYLIGLYRDDKLFKTIKGSKKISDEFPLIFKDIYNNYDIKNIYFVNGPGSYMSIKLIYIFLSSLFNIKNINLYASLGFEFNNNMPIKAIGNKCFILKDNNIELQNIDKDLVFKEFVLPSFLDKTKFSKDLEPKYILPVI